MSVAGATLFTTDSPARVEEFYRGQLPDWLVVTQRDGSTRFEHKKGGVHQIVAIHTKSDGTHIGIAAIGQPASN